MDLEDDQRFKLMKFKNVISDIRQPHHDDAFLLRWLRARSWNIEAAEKMLRQSMLWRQQWEVDTTLKTWIQPEVIQLYHPSGTCGFDKDGAPIIVVPFAGLDIFGLLNSTSKQDLIRTTIQILEKNLEVAKETGANSLVVIFDMEDFNLKQYIWRPAGEYIIALVQMYEANYPEILKACYIINVPSVFAIAFNIVKRFLNEYTLSKIQIFKKEPKKWKDAVAQNITEDNLPNYLGGTLMDSDGNPRYTTKIKQGGKVPESFYTKNAQDNNDNIEYTVSVIRKGEKLCLDYLVEEPDCFLRWQFKTDGHDIRFGITLKDAEGGTSPVVRHSRVSSHEIDEVGVLACQAPATYTVTFDNSYSLLRSKKIYHCIYVSPPVKRLEILPEEKNILSKNLEKLDI
ncbi:SEC14-like protein 2 isoform X1 [Rhynchophorus ferrugineus]|uniref:SEC14-like protein 2 isoform X1 n=2 Tax=Rhynchophorus ferrugineus TaxID=354439 RepID=UPI003FCE79A9